MQSCRLYLSGEKEVVVTIGTRWPGGFDGDKDVRKGAFSFDSPELSVGFL